MNELWLLLFLIALAFFFCLSYLRIYLAGQKLLKAVDAHCGEQIELSATPQVRVTSAIGSANGSGETDIAEILTTLIERQGALSMANFVQVGFDGYLLIQYKSVVRLLNDPYWADDPFYDLKDNLSEIETLREALTSMQKICEKN
jgi:hypothetical protein